MGMEDEGRAGNSAATGVVEDVKPECLYEEEDVGFHNKTIPLVSGFALHISFAYGFSSSWLLWLFFQI